MLTIKKEDEITLDQLADEIALAIADSDDSEKALMAHQHFKTVNNGIVLAKQTSHPELDKLRKLVSAKVKEILNPR